MRQFETFEFDSLDGIKCDLPHQFERHLIKYSMQPVLRGNMNPQINNHVDFQTNCIEEANSLQFYLSHLGEGISTCKPCTHRLKKINDQSLLGISAEFLDRR